MNQLIEFFSHLFDYSNWPPRWHCGKWSEFHGWLYIVSDLLIWSAYFAIPLLIIKFITKKHDAKFIKLYFLFAAFILACGATHFLDAVSFWFPMYRLNALVRFITGVISWFTVFNLYKLLPAAFALKTEKELQQLVNEKTTEIKEIFERVSDAFVALDKDWNYTYVNNKAYEIFERPIGSLLGKNIWEAFPDGIDKPFYHAYHKAMQTQQFIRLEEDHIPLGGWFESSIYPSPNGLSIYFKDITEKKKADEIAKQSDERFSLIARATTDVIWDWDLEKNTMWWNANFYDYFGYSKSMEHDINAWYSYIHEDDRDRVLQGIHDAVDNRTFYWSDEYRFLKADNTVINIYDRGYLLYHDDGKPYRMIGSMVDITEQKKVGQLIIKEKELSDSIINSLPGVFYLQDINGKYIRWNKQFETVSGYSADEIKNINTLDFFDEDKAIILEKIQQVFISGHAELEATIVTKSGARVPFYFTGRLIEYEGQQCLIGVGIDITDRKKAEEKANEAHKEMFIALNRINDSVVSVDNEWRYTFLNDASLSIHPSGREASLGKTILELHPEMESSELWKKYQEVMQTKIAAEIESYYEPLDFWASVKIYPSKDGLTFFYKDITERKKADEELKKSEKKYRLLFDNNPLPMWMIDVATLNIIDVNEAAIIHYGYTKQEFLSMNIRDIRPPEDVEKLEQAAASHNSSIRKVGIWNHLKKDGSIIKVEITSHDINYQNQLTRLVLSNDVTDKVKAEDALLALNTELKELYSYQQKIREEERKYIAREIHDELGQLITGLKMDISWLKKKIIQKQPELENKINETIELLDESVKTIRKISSELRPGILDDLGITDALAWLAKDFEKRTKIKCSLVNLAGDIECTSEVKVVLFRICQETLTNVMRHAEATRVDIKISIQNNWLMMQIIDNGKGFDVAMQTKTLGLLGMRERITNIEGELHISSSLGGGTSITINIPI